jgi:hypothetical protein
MLLCTMSWTPQYHVNASSHKHQLTSSFLTSSKSVDVQYHHHCTLDNLHWSFHWSIPNCYVLEAYSKLHPFVSRFCLCSFGPSCDTPSCHSLSMASLSQSFCCWVYPFLSLDLVPLRPHVIAFSMKKSHRNTSKPSHDFLASCALLLVLETQS